MGAAAASTLLLASHHAHAQKSASDGTRLEWIRLEGAEGCPARALFEQAVRTRMGGNPFSNSGKRTLTVELSSESGPFRAVLILKNEGAAGVDTRQELFSYSTACDELFGATVLSVSLLLSPREDDDANADVPSPEEEEEEESFETPQTTPRTRPTVELNPPELTRSSQVADPLPMAPRPWARKHSRAIASFVVALERLPVTTFGLSLRGEFPITAQWLVALEGTWLRSKTAQSEGVAAKLDVGSTSAWLDAVWIMYAANPLEVLLDLGIGLEVLHLGSREVRGPSGDAVQEAMRVGLGLNLQVDSRVALCSAFSAVIVPEQPEFEAAGTRLWQQTWLGGQLNFGLAIDFP
jgi:hypothetical protein